VIVTGTGLNTISQLDLRLDSGSPVISTNQLSLDGDKLTADFKDHPIPPGSYQVAIVVANGPATPTQTKLTVADTGASAAPKADPKPRTESASEVLTLNSATYDIKANTVKLSGKALMQIASVLLVPENGDNIVADKLTGTETERLANFTTQSIPPATYTIAYSIGEGSPTGTNLTVDVPAKP
jgi:hypothetical protein